MYDWGPYYTKQVQAAIDGTWKAGSYYGDLADGFTNIAPFGKRVTEESRTAIEAKKSEIIEGSFNEFQGPIVDQSGTEKVKAGEIMDFGEQMSIKWFVKGVEGEIPAS